MKARPYRFLTAGVGLAFVAAAFLIGFAGKSASDKGQFESISYWLMGIFSSRNLPDTSFEENYFAKLIHREPKLNYDPNPQFETLLRKSLSYSQISPTRYNGKPVHELHDLSLSLKSPRRMELLSKYDAPPLTLRTLWARAVAPNGDLFVILPDFRSSAAKILGLDNLDFQQQIGRVMNNIGFDVAVVDTISDPGIAAAINVRLVMLGQQLDGLQSHQTCSVIRWLKSRQEPNRVILYGLGSGGRLAEFVSVLCPDLLNLVIVDSIPLPWKRHLWRLAARSILHEPAILQYSGPFLSDSSFIDFMLSRRVPKLYLLDPATLNDIDALLKKHFKMVKPKVVGSGVVIAPRTLLPGISDVESVQAAVVDGKLDALAIEITPAK